MGNIEQKVIQPIESIVQAVHAEIHRGQQQEADAARRRQEEVARREALQQENAENVAAAKAEADRLASEAEALRVELQRLTIEKRLQEELRGPVTSQALIDEARLLFGIHTGERHTILCGTAGTGKSSTIRAIFALSPGSAEAPPSSVTECTMELKKYVSPSLANMALWDAPGCGTDSFPFYHPDPKLNYYRRFSVFAFHLVVVFSADRLSHDAVELARLCFQAGQPVIIVRNKADLMVEDMVENGEATDLEDAKSKAVRLFEEDVVKNLGPDLATRIPHYLISMRQYSRKQCDFGEDAFVQAMVAAGSGNV